MRKIFIILLLVIEENSWEANALQVSCESVGHSYWGETIGYMKTCNLRRSTSIDSEGIKISPDGESMQGLEFDFNKKIKFLPVEVSETFSNLLAYSAYDCSLTSIKKANFAGLNKLKSLQLNGNQISSINSETFEDLIALELLYLDNNKIKSMNGRAFAGLNQLKKVLLDGNVCIDERFEDQTSIATMTQVVNSKCAFDESLLVVSHSLDEKLKVLQIFMTTTLAEKERLQNEFSAAKSQITSKAAELKAAQDAKIQAEAQINEKNSKINELTSASAKKSAELRAAQEAIAQAEAKTKFVQDICKELDAQRNETFAAKTQELLNNYDFKTSENKNLLKENQKQSAMINANNLKVKQLEDEVKTVVKNCEC